MKLFVVLVCGIGGVVGLVMMLEVKKMFVSEASLYSDVADGAFVLLMFDIDFYCRDYCMVCVVVCDLFILRFFCLY